MVALAALRSVVKRFGPAGPAALDGVSLSIAPGQVTGLVGPDGAGKTTLIRILAGLLRIDSGEAEVLGAAPGLMAEDVGYMPQRFGLYEDLSVRQNLDLYARLRGLPAAEHAATFERLLRFTDLGRFQSRPAGKLSGGMKQKLGLACALVRAPRLLLLDEPSVGVDPVSRRELWSMVQSLVGEGIGVLWSTAYLDEAERCAEVLLLNEGRALYAGPPATLASRAEGRVYRLEGFEGTARAMLETLLNRPDVTDASIHGRTVRLLVDRASRGAPPLAVGQLSPIPARLEDGFIDILARKAPGSSPLARDYRRAPEDGLAIEAHGLTRRFGDFTAAEAIDLAVRPGEIFGLLGPNGAGKSTTFKMLCGLLSPSSGSSAVGGRPFGASAASTRSRLGYMAQKFSLYGDLSVAQNLNFFAGVYGLAPHRARARITELVAIFDLERHLPVNAGTLPLGYKQRLALACAVLHEPPVLFLDEPTSGVDPLTRREFWSHINGLVQRGVAVLVTTHFMEEAEYCDRIALVYRARIIASGAPDDLRTRAAERFGLTDPTMEDTFVALIGAAEAARETAGAAA
jgi:ABC-2 type transport system ATP-binding protein